MSGRRISTAPYRAAVAFLAAGCVIPAVSCQTRSQQAPDSGSLGPGASAAHVSLADRSDGGRYPAHWWEPVPESEAQWWEILPQAAGPGEVILSKRNELGLLSNFAPTPFVFRGKRYASLEGFWQSMKYPDGPDDPRSYHTGLVWPHRREEVAAMIAFEAKTAGDTAEEKMEEMGIDWVTFEGERMRYRGEDQGCFFEIIVAAMRAKARQNLEVEEVLLATGDLVLRPDHIREENARAAWRYDEIWMKLRTEFRAPLADG